MMTHIQSLIANAAKNAVKAPLLAVVMLAASTISSASFTPDTFWGGDYQPADCSLRPDGVMLCTQQGAVELPRTARFLNLGTLRGWQKSDLDYYFPLFSETYLTADDIGSYVSSSDMEAYVATAIDEARIGSGGTLLDIIDIEQAKLYFIFGFFSIFSVWALGFGVGLSRRLLYLLSK